MPAETTSRFCQQRIISRLPFLYFTAVIVYIEIAKNQKRICHDRLKDRCHGSSNWDWNYVLLHPFWTSSLIWKMMAKNVCNSEIVKPFHCTILDLVDNKFVLLIFQIHCWAYRSVCFLRRCKNSLWVKEQKESVIELFSSIISIIPACPSKTSIIGTWSVAESLLMALLCL